MAKLENATWVKINKQMDGNIFMLKLITVMAGNPGNSLVCVFLNIRKACGRVIGLETNMGPYE